MLIAMKKHLKPSGTVVVVDLLKTEQSHRFHGQGHHGVYANEGFSPAEMESYMKGRIRICKHGERAFSKVLWLLQF